MESEAYSSIARKPCLRVAMQDFDIHVLVESSGKPVAWSREDSPSSAGRRRIRYGRLVGRIAEPEDRERFEGPVEINGPVNGASTGSDGHVRVKVPHNHMSDKRHTAR
jgi:hypothetical protein